MILYFCIVSLNCILLMFYYILYLFQIIVVFLILHLHNFQNHCANPNALGKGFKGWIYNFFYLKILAYNLIFHIQHNHNFV